MHVDVGGQLLDLGLQLGLGGLHGVDGQVDFFHFRVQLDVRLGKRRVVPLQFHDFFLGLGILLLQFFEGDLGFVVLAHVDRSDFGQLIAFFLEGRGLSSKIAFQCGNLTSQGLYASSKIINFVVELSLSEMQESALLFQGLLLLDNGGPG